MNNEYNEFVDEIAATATDATATDATATDATATDATATDATATDATATDATATDAKKEEKATSLVTLSAAMNQCGVALTANNAVNVALNALCELAIADQNNTKKMAESLYAMKKAHTTMVDNGETETKDFGEYVETVTNGRYGKSTAHKYVKTYILYHFTEKDKEYMDILWEKFGMGKLNILSNLVKICNKVESKKEWYEKNLSLTDFFAEFGQRVWEKKVNAYLEWESANHATLETIVSMEEHGVPSSLIDNIRKTLPKAPEKPVSNESPDYYHSVVMYGIEFTSRIPDSKFKEKMDAYIIREKKAKAEAEAEAKAKAKAEAEAKEKAEAEEKAKQKAEKEKKIADINSAIALQQALLDFSEKCKISGLRDTTVDFLVRVNEYVNERKEEEKKDTPTETPTETPTAPKRGRGKKNTNSKK